MNKIYADHASALLVAYLESKATGQAVYRHEIQTKYGDRRWLVSLISDPVMAEIAYIQSKE
ncbi:hypothetical protein IV02_02975 [Pseudomonas syringae]|uniref:Uncharacterized protein n=1 Tax=Pseudomonas syringae TaxID=317 RepID=A0A085VHT7_PSESX|nr:hypothetical protein IV02_02975 [Pseudomonas syringae]